jgi:hypothetical protein
MNHKICSNLCDLRLSDLKVHCKFVFYCLICSSCWHNLASSALNTLHRDKHCYTITMWARSLETASWESHGKPNSLCLLQERNVGLDSWKNGYSRISPRRWQVFCLQSNHHWKRRLNLQWLVHCRLRNLQEPVRCRLRSLQRPVRCRRGLLNHC